MTSRPRRQEQEPASDEITEVAPGVLRLQLPVALPGLGHVNCYALEDSEGFALVDPGLPGASPWKALRTRLDQAGIPLRRVHTTVVTHSHPDHFGGALRLRHETGARVVTHADFRLFWDLVELDDHEDSGALELNDREAAETFLDHFRGTTPWGTEAPDPPGPFVELLFEERRPGERHPTLRPDTAVVDAEPIPLAGREWFAMHTPGHTHDHLCLHDPEHGVLLSGDHVLPSITPHIGGYEPHTDPLARFIGSLRRVAGLDGIVTVLPAHGHPFADLAGRATDIIDHHGERLARIRQSVAELGTADVVAHMQVLFREHSWGTMAESETFAHLVHLEARGEIGRVERDGPATFAARPDHATG